MTAYRVLLLRDLVPPAEAMCAALGVPCAVVSEPAAWDRPEHCLFQVDLPGLHARVVAEAAGIRGIAPETLLATWIARSRSEIERFGPDGAPDGLLRRCRLMAQWEALGYKGTEPVVAELARRFARE